jgi:pheromone shutdown protein TraB
MARAASKKQAAQNARIIQILTYGFLITNLIHLLLVFGVFRKSSATFGALFKYVVTEGIAGALGLTLRGMAKQGDDLGQAGLTS